MCKTFASIAILILIAGIFFPSCVKKVPEEIIWNDSLDQGLKLAKDQGKNLLVDFDKQG